MEESLIHEAKLSAVCAVVVPIKTSLLDDNVDLKVKVWVNPCKPIAIVSPFEGLVVIFIDPLAGVPLLENILPVPESG